MNTTLDFLKGRLSVLRQPETSPEKAQSLIEEIHQVFEQITQVSGYGAGMNFQLMAAVPTANGVALGLSHAAQCLLDFRRTTVFFQGILAAIEQRLQAHPDQTVQIFYAGCGPFAPWVTLIAPLFTPDQVQISLLEINHQSLDIAHQLIQTLGLEAYVNAYHQADAITFVVPEASKYHVLISETLDAVLHRESYVAILWNLLPQFPKEIVLLPENVQLQLNLLCLAEGKGPNDPLEEEDAGIIFDTRSALSALEADQALPESFPPTRVKLDPELAYRGIQINTKVMVFQDFQLFRGESSLTLPANVGLQHTPEPQELVFRYLTHPQMELNMQVQAITEAEQ